MLINRTGFKAFNEYDLSKTLESQLARLRVEVEGLIKVNRKEDVPSVAEKYKITPLSFDTNNLTIKTETGSIPAEYFPNDFWVDRGKKYQKDVFVFYLPFTGDRNILHCVPSTRILWTEEIALEGNDIVFEIIKFTDDVESVRRKKDDVINFLNSQSGNVNNQIEQYNNSIVKIIAETATNTETQIAKHDDFLAQLGVPLKPKAMSAAFPSEDIKKIEKSRIVDKKPKTFDVFICHASEDKSYVDKLADALKVAGINVWYDSFQIGWGDDLRPAIDDGLKNSRFGIVVISTAFLNKKKWTDYELNGLFSKEKKGSKVILPIWHDITRENVARYSPTFADRIAKDSKDIESMVKELKSLL
ncbi:MAG: toll/interleukin-1 receptor domain-containing protein [Candidatus Paceibacterota bacterium]